MEFPTIEIAESGSFNRFDMFSSISYTQLFVRLQAHTWVCPEVWFFSLSLFFTEPQLDLKKFTEKGKEIVREEGRSNSFLLLQFLNVDCIPLFVSQTVQGMYLFCDSNMLTIQDVSSMSSSSKCYGSDPRGNLNKVWVVLQHSILNLFKPNAASLLPVIVSVAYLLFMLNTI